MSYKWLNGFKTSLPNKLDSTTRLLPIENVKELAKKLGDGHTYLTITDGLHTEIVKAERFGNEVKLYRGQEETEAKTFPAGSCIKWEVTKSGIEETICSAEFSCQEKLNIEKACDCCRGG